MTTKHIPPLEIKTKEGWYLLISGGYTKKNLNEWKAASIKWHGEAKFEVKEFKKGKTVLYGLYRLMK